MRTTPRVAGFRSEYPAGFELECMAGFVGIRSMTTERMRVRLEHYSLRCHIPLASCTQTIVR
ncbi:hypothetical protein ABIB82_006014 [Bradyrhizobium sp. i1.8.4]|uniref:hypothetical protein n=1 Tax=unclassified Bradyrhizobium TaxID=2631580 RepID=UPI003D1B89E9